MVTEQVERSLENKSPITRGSKSHERTFEIEAIEEEGGVKSYITNIQIEERYSPMHYDLKWSTSDDRNVPFVGTGIPNKEEISSVGEDNTKRGVPATPKPSHSVAVVFKTINGDTYHMRWSTGMISIEDSELLLTLLCDIDPTEISEEKPIDATYEPTSDTGGSLKIGFDGDTISGRRRAFEGKPNDKHDNNAESLNRASSWLSYMRRVRNGTEWIECPVINAYESEDGEEISLVVETPIGEATVFEFEVTPDKSSQYWALLDDIAQGDPANLSDSNNSVYLRHRSRSFYNLTVSEHRDVVNGRTDNVVGIDVNWEWELRTTKSYIKKSNSCDRGKRGILNRVLDLLM